MSCNIYSMVPVSSDLDDPQLRFQVHGVIRPIYAIEVLCAQLTRDMFIR